MNSSTFFATCAGNQIVSGSLMIPLVGIWTADLQLATSEQVNGPVTVVIGNLTLQGFVYRSEAYGGQTRARLVGGYGGWRTSIDEQGYGNNAGVQLSMILGDAAMLCGEQINIVNNGSVGNAFTRVAGPASDILWQLMSQGFYSGWYIDTTGVTQTAPWPNNQVQTPFTVTDQRPDEGLVVIATEDYASWVPGCTFSAPQLAGTYTNGGVTYVFDNDGKFRMEVLTGTTDRLLGALEALIGRQVAPTRFYGRYEYTISNPSTTTVDCDPAPGALGLGLPSLQNVPIDADSISTYVPPSGGLCHIMFVNGLPTRPICVWTAGTATMVNILGGSNPVARQGDQVTCFLPPSLVIVGLIDNTESFSGTITVPNPISGSISGPCSPTVNTQ